jgi:sulfite exporter TauE/SafE
MDWIIGRVKEPSSYAAAGSIMIGIGVITSQQCITTQSWLVIIGVIGGAVGFALKERGRHLI